MRTIKKLIIATAIFSIYTSVANAHLLAFDKLTPANKTANVVTSFQLTKQEIVDQFHYRAKFFEIERWMLSKNIQLVDNHYYGQHAQQMAAQRASQQSSQGSLQTNQGDVDIIMGMHYLIDPAVANAPNNTTKMHYLIDPAVANAPNNTTNQLNIAGFVAVSMCNAYKSINIKNNTPNLVPKFKAPLSFIQGIDPKNKDISQYKLSDGISFDCVYYKQKSNSIYKEKIKAIKAPRSMSKHKH